MSEKTILVSMNKDVIDNANRRAMAEIRNKERVKKLAKKLNIFNYEAEMSVKPKLHQYEVESCKWFYRMIASFLVVLFWGLYFEISKSSGWHLMAPFMAGIVCFFFCLQCFIGSYIMKKSTGKQYESMTKNGG